MIFLPPAFKYTVASGNDILHDSAVPVTIMAYVTAAIVYRLPILGRSPEHFVDSIEDTSKPKVRNPVEPIHGQNILPPSSAP